jgi:nitroreductase
LSEETFVPLEFIEYRPDEMVERSRSFYEAIRRRRSVREFSSRPIPVEVIENALRAAGSAPSGANRQPWHFVAVSDTTTKRRIREAAEENERAFYARRAPDEWLQALAPLGTDADKPFLEAAPYLVVVFAKRKTVDEQGVAHRTYFPNESVGIATGLLIAALHLSGLATLTYTPSPMQFLNGLLDRPDYERPYLVLVTGYPAEDASVPALDRLSLGRIATFVGR